MLGNRNTQSRTFVKPRALNTLKKPVDKQSKPPSKRSVKKSSSPTPSVTSGYSLYSGESEPSSGGVGSINRGLDRCAALLANILDDDDGYDLPSKLPTTANKATGATKPVSKVKQTNKGITRVTKHTQSIKKNKQKPPVTSKRPAVNAAHQNGRKQPTTTTGRPNKLHKDNRIQEKSMPQFNNRLVSSTPNMGSPTSSDHNEDDTVNPPAHQDPSLEALAAQIRILRSQAEIAESCTQPSANIPPSEQITTQSNRVGNRMQEPSLVDTSVVRQEKVDFESEAGMLLRGLSNHFKDKNNRQQGQGIPNQLTNQQTTHNELPIQQQRPPEAISDIQADTLPTASAPLDPTYQRTLYTQFEQPGSTNVSFLGEYHQLPSQNLDTIPTREIRFDPVTITQKSSAMPVLQLSQPADVQNKMMTNQGLPAVHIDNNNTPMHSHHKESTQAPCTMHSPQETQRAKYHSASQKQSSPEKQLRNNFQKHDMDIQAISMGTQTYSPPADKGVQTSSQSSPSSINPSSDSDESNKPAGYVSNHVTDTPRLPQQMSSGKKSASWEQMRVLKYLMGELRAAICELEKDNDVERLITEILDCMDTLQYLPPDLQAELALALQPLRSENSQLRRRLRIANQQIRQLEKRSDKENMDPLIDVEVLTLQSLNAKLQKDLREEINQQKSLAASVAEHKTIAENLTQKNRDLMMLLQQKDNHQLDSRQEWLVEKSAHTHQINQIVAAKDDLQFKIDALNKEKNILQLSLQQRDAEIKRLQQDPDSNYPGNGPVYDKKDVRTTSDSDEDDDTPKASPQSSPLRMSHALSNPTPLRAGQSRHNVDRETISTHPVRLHNSDVVGHTSEYQNGYASQGLSKTVTFAQYKSPSPNRAGTNHQRARSNYMDYNTSSRQSRTHLVGNGYSKSPRIHFHNQLHQPIDPTSEHNGIQPNAEPLFQGSHTQNADVDFSMRKFLQHSTVADDNVLSEPDINKPLESNAYHTTNTISPYKNSAHLASHTPDEQALYVERQQSYHPRFVHREPCVYNSIQTQPVQKVTQDGIFQGSVLDGSVSGIDSSTVVSESTQSSVTSQYEAQFQLGLASLDSEIEKLQNSLKSMGNGKLSV